MLTMVPMLLVLTVFAMPVALVVIAVDLYRLSAWEKTRKL